MASVRIKRIYDAPHPDDGLRVLVDRLWPRGLSKDRTSVDHWLRDIAPSDELRHWFGHEAPRWAEFERRYFAELDANADVVARLRALIAEAAMVTLLYAARDEAHNNARALADYLDRG